MYHLSDDQLSMLIKAAKHILEGKPVNLVITLGNQQTNKLYKIMANLKDLQAAVEKDTQLDSSAITLIKGIAKKLEDAKGDQKKIDQLTKQLNDSADAFAAAIVANTPAEDTPPVDTPPVDEPPVDQPPVDVPPVDTPPVTDPGTPTGDTPPSSGGDVPPVVGPDPSPIGSDPLPNAR